jgi:hypothetical protein
VPDGGAEGSTVSASGLSVEALDAVEDRQVRTVKAQDTESFVVARVRLRNGTDEALPLAFALFALESDDGVQRFGDPTTARVDDACPTAATLARGGDVQCTVVFRVPRSPLPKRLVYRAVTPSTASYEASSPIRIVRCTTCDGRCVHVDRDPDHCGRCDASVGLGECSAGKPSCDDGATLCGSRCVDVKTDPQHCGRCDRPVPPGKECRSGEIECPPGLTLCGGACVDTMTNPAHCGGCDRPVLRNGSCEQGRAACSGTRCGDECVDLWFDPRHCGGCGRVCPPGAYCYASHCVR